MAYNRKHARPLLTKPEYELFEASLSDKIGTHTRARLRSKIDRTRKLRDKYRDLYRRQRLATRDRTGTKGGRSGAANDRTQQKADLFAEVLGRFEAQLAKVDAAEARKAEKERLAKARAVKGRKAPKPSKRTTAKKAAARKATAKRAASARTAASRKATTRSSPRNKAITAHVGARGRRTQARRDSR